MAASFAFIGFGEAAQYISRGPLDEGAARPDITSVAWRFMRHAGPTRWKKSPKLCAISECRRPCRKLPRSNLECVRIWACAKILQEICRTKSHLMSLRLASGIRVNGRAVSLWRIRSPRSFAARAQSDFAGTTL